MPLQAVAPPEFIPDAEAKTDVPDFIPDNHPDAQVASGKAAPPAFIPDSGFRPDAEAYGTPEQQALAGVEGVMRGASLGLSDLAETKLAGVNPEEIRARQQANPWTSGITTALGGAGTAALTGGGSLIAEGLGGGALAGAIGLGAEGAVFGAGNAVSEAALGDPDLNAQKVLSHILWGTALGAGLGAVVGHLGAFGERAAQIEADTALGAGETGSGITGFDDYADSTPVYSAADLRAKIANAQKKGLSFELPQKAALLEAASQVPDMEIPIMPQQIAALDSPAALDDYRIKYREGDSSIARDVQAAEAIQKEDLNLKTDQAIASLSPNVTPTADPVQGGIRATQAFTEQYNNEKNQLVPMFKALERINLGPLRADIVPLMETLSNKIPAVARMFNYGEDGLIKDVESFDPKWGLSRAAYNAVKGVFESLESGAEEPASFQDLLNLRGNMDEHVNIIAPDQGPAQIRGLKGAFMDYLQNLADDHIPDVALRDIFKRYAINEQNRQIIQRTFGSGVGAQDLNFIPKNPSEDILGKIFRNTETVKAAKRILDPAKFDELLASHLAHVKESFTKNGVFSSNNFLNYLRRHGAELGEAFGYSPQAQLPLPGAPGAPGAVFKRLLNLSTISTIVPDSARANPSGTAKTLVGLTKNIFKDSGSLELGAAIVNPKILLGIYGKKALGILQELHADRNATREFESGLVGKAAKAQSLELTQKILSAVNANLDRSARAIFKQEPANAQ